MMNFIEELGITGHLTIIKQFNDGKEEVVFDDHNIIVSGMGVGLSYLFTGSGSQNILDFQLDRFQIGVSGQATSVDANINQVSSTFALSGPLAIGQYGTNSNLYIEEASQIKNGVTFANQPFALIPASKITRINDSSVRYTLVVGEEAANGLKDAQDFDLSLNEIGLFMKNPVGSTDPNVSILTAYRSFSNIVKTNDFSLIFRWTINF
jgi:hypothetical protein